MTNTVRQVKNKVPSQHRSRYLDLVAMGLASEFETRVFPIEKDAFVAGASVASFLAVFLVSGLRF